MCIKRNWIVDKSHGRKERSGFDINLCFFVFGRNILNLAQTKWQIDIAITPTELVV